MLLLQAFRFNMSVSLSFVWDFSFPSQWKGNDSFGFL